MPHPGWRHRVPEGRTVLVDQAAALARVEELVGAELWRADRRAVALGVLRGLVHGMSWETGLVAGVTRAHLAAAAACSVRTVSRVVAWAVDVDLLVCVETGATAEFLGTEANRAPSYVLTAAVPPSKRRGRGEHCGDPTTAPIAVSVDELGNPPANGGWRSSPRCDRGLKRGHDETRARLTERGADSSWPVFDRALSTRDRARASDTLIERAGLSGRVPRWRARALLGPWFEAGWSVIGLLHALDHHPDRPDASRGDAARAARDPLRVLGHRLAPWRGRLADLPATLAAVDGHARRARVASAHEADVVARWPAVTVAGPVMAGGRGGHGRPMEWPRASVEVRAAARAELAQALARPRWSR